MEELMARYLAGDLSEEERTSFETTLITDENVSREFEAYMNLWQLSHDSNTTMSFDTNKAWEVVKEDIKEESKVVPIAPKRPFSFLKIAATFLILAVGGYFLVKGINNNPGQPEYIEVVSKLNVKQVTLPDGSIVKMNANSKITYAQDFNSSERKVTLVGEADFDVVRNEKVPFIVEAGASKIEVLGTRFDVIAYPDKHVELNVSEGKVAFSPMSDADKSEILIEGQKATLDIESNQIEVSAVENMNYAGWWTRKLVYEETKLSEVLEDLERTYWVEFEYDEEIADCTYTGTHEGQSVDDIVEIIQSSFQDVKSSRTQENKIKLSGKGCK